MKKLLLVLAAVLLAPTLFAAGYTRNVAIVLYNGVEILDFAGPAEVFAASSGHGANGQERAFNVYLVSKTRKGRRAFAGHPRGSTRDRDHGHCRERPAGSAEDS